MDQPEHARQMLVAELRRQVAAWSPPEPVREREISWFDSQSTAVPDLNYYVADYRPRVHDVAQAVVGARHDKVVLLGTPQAWWELTAEWSPADERQVIAACREFIRAAGRSRIRANVPQVLTRQSLQREGIHPRQLAEFSTRKGIDGPVVTRSGSVWHAELWVAEVRLGYTPFAMKYGCTFSGQRNSPSRPSLSVVDSIPGLAAPIE